MLKRRIALLVAMVVFAASFTALADNREKETLVDIAREICPGFLGSQTYETTTHDLVTPFGEGILTVFTNARGEEIGYIIFVDGVILELAESPSPYEDVEPEKGERLYYQPGVHSKVDADEAAKVLASPQSIESQTEENAVPPMTRGYKILSNVTCNYQGSYNCVAAALSNVIWYWGGHGYSSLTSGMSFSDVADDITAIFNGSFANNSVLSVANTYAGMYTSSNYFTGGATWSPYFYDAYSEIDAGYPCMVGFASGNTAYDGEAHMTMCFGYQNYNSTYYYVYLADGHHTYGYYQLWTSYNDCVIKLRIH